jgi:DNA-binding transcriptional regulator YbjK
MRTKLVNAALSLISDEGVTELRHFLHDARATGTE